MGKYEIRFGTICVCIPPIHKLPTNNKYCEMMFSLINRAPLNIVHKRICFFSRSSFGVKHLSTVNVGFHIVGHYIVHYVYKISQLLLKCLSISNYQTDRQTQTRASAELRRYASLPNCMKLDEVLRKE